MFPTIARLQTLLLYGILGAAVITTMAWMAVLGYGLVTLLLRIFLLDIRSAMCHVSLAWKISEQRADQETASTRSSIISRVNHRACVLG
jgi:hypothetical protein